MKKWILLSLLIIGLLIGAGYLLSISEIRFIKEKKVITS